MSHSKKLEPKVAILMGSSSDYPVMKEAEDALKQFQIPSVTRVLSAHRTPEETIEFAKKARENGFKILIAGAGGAAHLPGVLAAMTVLPVIGVPIASTPLHGQDALLAMVQMPKGVPVATVAIGGAYNAGILAAQILGVGGSEEVLERILQYKRDLKLKILSQKL